MPNIRTEINSTKPNPDQGFLKKLVDAEAKELERDAVAQKKRATERLESRQPLVKASGLTDRALLSRQSASAKASKAALTKDKRALAQPAVDISALHKQDLDAAKAVAEQMNPRGNPSWAGYLWNSSYAGYWSNWNGESEEVPNVTMNPGANRVDPRAQAWGEGWFDGDYSKTHAYLAFRFRPPSWGHLHIRVCPWLHGYYSLYSNDDWYNSEYARVDLDTWVDLHQNFWRPRQYGHRLWISGQELHPTRSGRRDASYCHSYYTNVGTTDTVTIRVGAKLDCYARASGSRAVLNFQTGAGNYVYVPYVYWYLHH